MFDAELNDPQAEAVAHVNGPLLVFAGAGSGKTRVITYRIANLVACGKVPPFRVLAVTFTNKAAGEMRARLAKLLGEDVAKDLWVGTFHATCAKLLRLHGASIGLARNFVIYDSADQKAVVNRVLKELDLDEKRYPPRAVLSAIHKQKQEGRGPEEMALDSYMDDAVHKIYVAYEKHLASANAVDFEDLILRVDRILMDEKNPEAAKIRKRWEYVLVDEFQDTNFLQYRFLRELAKDHRNLCVVGDDDQSIYRWRGADVRNIRGFKKDFPGAMVVKLEQNYRSTKSIVAAALAVIEPSKDREPKELWTANGAGSAVEVVAAKDERDEAAHVINVIRESRELGIGPRDIAVFYRIHAQSRVIEEALRSVNVPYQIVGGTKFYERAEVKDALSYLRILVNPQSDVDLLRVINTPARGIGSTTIERLTAYATARECSVFQALDVVDEMDELNSGAKKKLDGVKDLLDGLRKDAANMSPANVLANVLEQTGYRKSLKEANDAESDARLENLEELYGSLLDYEKTAEAEGKAPTLEDYLERVSLVGDVDAMNEEGRVTLMTVHSAKGLEFEVVALTGMEEEMFPYRGLDAKDAEELDEERRLAYVAITRARRRLVMTHTQTRQIFGTTRYGKPSRFLGDLPKDVSEQRATSAMRAGGAPRYIDRASWAPERPPTSWRHPQQRSSDSERAPGERFVDTEFFDDGGANDVEAPIRRGSRVFHERFGKGEVRSLGKSNMGEASVVAFFPGWGEKKILARFLKLA
jgi:DNA helicase-2/ATP-dependent DNA helicase PcrA